MSILVTHTPLTLRCPVLFFYQEGILSAEAVGELVHGGGHHFCSVNQLLCPAAGEKWAVESGTLRDIIVTGGG